MGGPDRCDQEGSRQWLERAPVAPPEHLDTCQFETIVKARIPQLKYSDGTVEELTVPWAERCSRATTMMAGFVIKQLLEACTTMHSDTTVLEYGKRHHGQCRGVGHAAAH